MSVWRDDKRGGWVAKFQLNGEQHWVPEGPWRTKEHAQIAERRHRDRLKARASSETCASFAELWLAEWPRPESSTRRPRVLELLTASLLIGTPVCFALGYLAFAFFDHFVFNDDAGSKPVERRGTP